MNLAVESKEINISFEDWHWECGDGCCDNYGTTLRVGDETITEYADLNFEETIVELLEHLGYKVNVTHINSTE